jgi:isopentenyl-diphosphate Delta-isomerase
VWTNSCCGHPMLGEPLDRAVLRRLSYELGLPAQHADLVLPRVSYRAVMGNGIVEHELCPVYRVTVDLAEAPNPDEVDDTRWMPWSDFAKGVLSGLLEISPWCREQVPLLTALGPDPLRWPTAPDDELPPAARVRLD